MTQETGTTSKNSAPEAYETFVVVLTGGIASGKSTVSNLFRDLGVPIVDTDVIARQLVEPFQPAAKKILRAFGGDFFLEGGQLDRQRMREEIFGNPASKKKLENILHPLIREEVISQLVGITFPYCLLIIPLFVESREFWQADHVLVVDANESAQIERIMARDGTDKELAKAILDSQATRQERLTLADDVIQNDFGLEELTHTVRSLHEKYLALAERKRRLRKKTFG